MSRKLPPLNAVKAFEAAARQGSFARAAKELTVTSTAISQHVKGLESWLGVALFKRSANGVKLTLKGEQILGDITRILDELAALVPPAIEIAEKTELTIAAPPALIDGLLLSSLDEFTMTNPAIAVGFRDRAVATKLLKDPDIDFVIVPNAGQETSVLLEPLFEDKLVPVCTPQYRDLLGLQNPHNWRSVTLIHDSMWDGDWKRWGKQSSIALDWEAGLNFPNHSLAIEAAKQGRGILIAHQPLVEQQISTGSLVALSEAPLPTGDIYYLARRRGHISPPAIQLRAWLLSKLRR